MAIQYQGGQPPIWQGPPGRPPIRPQPQRPWDNSRRMKWNKKNSFDAALDALRTQGLTQEQFSNLQGGNLPGHLKGMFLGMSPDQLKQVASFVDAQGSALPGTKHDPITGALIPGAMHYNYNDPRLANGESASEDPTLPPWMQQGPMAGGGQPPQWGGPQGPPQYHPGVGPGRMQGPGMPPGMPRPYPIPGQGPPGRQFTGIGSRGYGRGLHGMAPGQFLGQGRRQNFRQQLIAHAMQRTTR